MNKIISILFILSSLFIFSVFGIYEEEIGKRDWSIHNIGQFENSIPIATDKLLVQSKILNKVDQTISNSSEITTTSYVISLLDSKAGQQKWRQLLPQQEQSFQTLSLNSFDNNFFLTLSNNKIIRYWNIENGDLVWSYDISNSGESSCYSVDVISKETSTVPTIRVLCNGSILFIKKERLGVTVLSQINNMDNEIYNTNRNGENVLFNFLPNSIYYSSNDGKQINLVEFDQTLFKPSKLITLSLESEPMENDNLNKVNNHLVSKSNKFIAVSTRSTINVIYKSKLFTTTCQQLLGDEYKKGTEIVSIESLSHTPTATAKISFSIILSNGKIVIVQFNEKSNQLDKIEIYSDTDIIQVIQQTDSEELYTISKFVKNDGAGTKFKIGQNEIPSISIKGNGEIEKIQSFGNYILISMADWSINMFSLNQDGSIKLLWARNEALSFILSSEIMDYPLPDISKLDQLSYEFNEADGFLTHFSKRISTQIQDIFGFASSKDTTTKVTTEEIKKLIIVSTYSGRLFGITDNGKILWSNYYSDFKGDSLKMNLYLTKKAIYSTPPELAVLYSTLEVPKSIIVWINPLTGLEYKEKKQIISHSILHAAVLSQMSDPTTHVQMMYWVLNYPLDHPSPMVTLYPWNESTRKNWSAFKRNHFFLTDKSTSTIKGYGIESLADGKHGGFKSEPIWNLHFENQQILTVGQFNDQEVVQSPAIILGNRNLLPKYLNRNMISIATLDESSNLQITLVDSITGEIIKSFTHQHCSEQVSIVQTENSVVYAHFDIVSQAQLISSIDIFEKNIDWKTTTVSSFNETIENQLIIKHKTFVFTNGPIKTMSLSITTKGITSKNIIAGLVNGQILPIDKKWVNSRRPYPSEATPEDVEEQLIPYKPLLQFPPWFFTTYNSTVNGLTTIESTGTDLESTSLLFSFGQPDIFCILIAPSLPYDILSDQFNHISLIITSLTLLILVFVAKNYKNSLLLSKKWK